MVYRDRSRLMLVIILASASEFLWPSADHLIFLCVRQLEITITKQANLFIFCFLTNVLFSFLIRELFLKTNAQLTIRCRQLLSELSYIYPIDLVSFRFSGEKKIFLRDFYLKFPLKENTIALVLANIYFKSRFRIIWH